MTGPDGRQDRVAERDAAPGARLAEAGEPGGRLAERLALTVETAALAALDAALAAGAVGHRTSRREVALDLAEVARRVGAMATAYALRLDGPAPRTVGPSDQLRVSGP